MSINLGTVVKSRLADGKHNIKLAYYTVVNNEKGGYIELGLKFEDRVVKWNVFPTQFDYVFGSFQRQFDLLTDEVSYQELLDLAKAQSFDIWKTVNEYGINFSLSAPKVELVQETDVSDLDI